MLPRLCNCLLVYFHSLLLSAPSILIHFLPNSQSDFSVHNSSYIMVYVKSPDCFLINWKRVLMSYSGIWHPIWPSLCLCLQSHVHHSPPHGLPCFSLKTFAAPIKGPRSTCMDFSSSSSWHNLSIYLQFSTQTPNSHRLLLTFSQFTYSLSSQPIF